MNKIKSQMLLKDKIKLADLLLDNSKTPEDTYGQLHSQLA